MEKQRNKTLNEYLKALNIDINELTNYELESLEKTNEYYNDKLSELEEFTKKVNFKYYLMLDQVKMLQTHIHALINSLTKETRNTKRFLMILSTIKPTKSLNQQEKTNY